MKKTIRIITAITLAVVLIICAAWYLLVYDREFTRDMLLSCARGFESGGNHNTAAWFYNLAYSQSENSDSVAIELAQQYKNSGNYTKAEYTLYNAISEGGGFELYIALSKLYVEQDKLLDAVNMLNSVANADIKAQLESMRPAAPVATPEPAFYNQYISVTLEGTTNTIYFSSNGQYPSTAGGGYVEPIMLKDGENTIQAISVADNGLVSPLATFGYTVGGVIKPVEFTDSDIESQVRSLIGASNNKELFTNDLWDIKSFTVPEGAKDYKVISDMVFLEELTIESGVSEQLSCISGLSHLQKLIIKNTAVSQETLESIGSLPKLTSLTLSGCSLTSIGSLNKSTGLTYLDLSGNAIRDITALAQMTALTELYLQSNAITDISAISNATSLVKLNLSQNSITSLAPLSTLVSINWLDAGTNALNDLGDFGKLTELSYLSLSSNQLSDISQIGKCTKITELYISSNAISDISALASLSQMQHFNFSHNQVASLPKWSSNCDLVDIDGSYNNLDSLDNLSGLSSLSIVNMDYNPNIRSITSLSKCPVLLEVNVYGTAVSDVKSLTSQSIVVNYNPVN